LKGLEHLPVLDTVFLDGNVTLSREPNYRKKVALYLPRLKQLDLYDVIHNE
jgi:hypothetical protein